LSGIRIKAHQFEFVARLDMKAAPKTCALFRSLLPYRQKLIHVRWSGEGVWIPLGGQDFGLSSENATSHPAPGDVILYPGGLSETEFLIAYGAVDFSSKVGQLAGNHFMTIVEGREQLRLLGEHVLWHGATDVLFEDVV
jgi:hypothetical protein